MTGAEAAPTWRLPLARGRSLDLGRRPKVMGILNITPDSFSDGGLWLEPARAVEHGLRMLAEGAEILDLGAESTRPGGGVYGAGARGLSPAEEMDRLLPVLEELRPATEAPISVDTRQGAVARAALAAGADLINDVGGLRDEELGRAVAEAGCPLVLMHSRGELASMQKEIRFDDAPGEVRAELAEGIERSGRLGIAREQLILDPGIGFGKRTRENLELIARLDRLAELGRPLLLGASRKSFLAAVRPAEPAERLGGSLAALAWGALGGAAIVRVHDVAESRQFLAVHAAVEEAGRASRQRSR